MDKPNSPENLLFKMDVIALKFHRLITNYASSGKEQDPDKIQNMGIAFCLAQKASFEDLKKISKILNSDLNYDIITKPRRQTDDEAASASLRELALKKLSEWIELTEFVQSQRSVQLVAEALQAQRPLLQPAAVAAQLPIAQHPVDLKTMIAQFIAEQKKLLIAEQKKRPTIIRTKTKRRPTQRKIGNQTLPTQEQSRRRSTFSERHPFPNDLDAFTAGENLVKESIQRGDDNVARALGGSPTTRAAATLAAEEAIADAQEEIRFLREIIEQRKAIRN
jgi:hypothetical protein